MSNELMQLETFKMSALVQDSMQELLKLTKQALVPGVGGTIFPRISSNRRRFSIVRAGTDPVLIDDGAGHAADHLDVVVLGTNAGTYKSYYEKGYDSKAEKKEMPVCWSSNGVTPFAGSEKVQSASCHNCPHNVFGSKITDNGSKGKACADSKRLLVISPDDLEGDVYMVGISATALSGWNSYLKMLAGYKTPMQLVATRLTFDEKMDVPVFQFSAAGRIAEADVSAVLEHLGAPDVKEFLGGTYDSESEAPRTVYEDAAAIKPEPKAAPEPKPKAAEEKPKRGFGGAAKHVETTKPEGEVGDEPDLSGMFDF